MSETEKAVQKATDSKNTAPKRKHVRTIIIETWNENSARTFFAEVSKRPLDTSDIVCFKGLTTTHKVIQEGPRQALIDSYYRLQWLDNLRDYWNRQPERGYSHLNYQYSTFLHDKILFHHRHTEFEGDISLEKFLKHHKPDSFEMEKCIEIVSHLLDLQESVFKMQISVIGPKDVSECKAGSLIPLVLESYAIFTVVTYFLTKMVDRVDSMDVLQFLIERYYSQYITLREFYVNANAIRSVSGVIAVPNLPPDPPRFNVKKTKDNIKPRVRKGNTPTPPRRDDQLKPPPTLQVQPQHEPHLLIDPFPATQQLPQSQIHLLPQSQLQLQPPTPAWTTFSAPPAQAQHNLLNTVYTTPVTSSLKQSQPPTTQWVTFGNQDDSGKSADPFSDLLTRSKSETKSEIPTITTSLAPSTATITSAAAPARATATNPPPKPPPAPTPAPTPQAITTTAPATPSQATVQGQASSGDSSAGKTRVITKIITKTVTNTAELNTLKTRIEELENELTQEREINKTLTEKLSEREVFIQGLEVAKQQIQIAYEGASKQAGQLRVELDAVLDAQHEERWSRAVAEISAGKDNVEMTLAELDSPTNLGNQEATAALVVEQAGAVGRVAARLVQVCEGIADESINQNELFSAVSAVSGALRSLFTDAKGASRLVEDLAVRQKLLESAREVGLQTTALLESMRAQGGQPQDDEEHKILRENREQVLSSITKVIEACKEVENSQQKQQAAAAAGTTLLIDEVDQSGIDLDDLAERELRAAAKTIEDAAKSLIAARAAKPPKEPTDTRPDVAEAILEAAMAITNATSTLVASATTAQRERAERGRAIAATGAPYKRDPTWAEGLISAAKAVAQATAALVGVANDAVNKKEGASEEGLIAVSKAVAAATSQLVAAARAKSESHSPTQEKLSIAAKSVSHATSLLVAAARAAATKDEKDGEEDYSKLNATGYKVKEMEQTMQILRLEKELEKARKALLSMRKSEYARAVPAPAPTTN